MTSALMQWNKNTMKEDISRKDYLRKQARKKEKKKGFSLVGG